MGWIETCFSFRLRFRHLFLWFATFSLYERISSSLVDSLLVRWAQLSLTVCCNEIPFGRPKLSFRSQYNISLYPQLPELETIYDIELINGEHSIPPLFYPTHGLRLAIIEDANTEGNASAPSRFVVLSWKEETLQKMQKRRCENVLRNENQIESFQLEKNACERWHCWFEKKQTAGRESSACVSTCKYILNIRAADVPRNWLCIQIELVDPQNEEKEELSKEQLDWLAGRQRGPRNEVGLLLSKLRSHQRSPEVRWQDGFLR